MNLSINQDANKGHISPPLKGGVSRGYPLACKQRYRSRTIIVRPTPLN